MSLEGVLSSVLPALGELLRAPLQKPSLIWQLAPILCIWILVEFYFGMHKKEKLGWNTSLTNGISLFWIVISAMQYIFSDKELFSWPKFGLILFIALYALFIMYISFKHTFKAKLTFLFASPTPLFYFSALALFFAHDVISFSWPMLIAIFLLYIIILLVITIIKKLLPELKEDEPDKEDKGLDDFSSDASLPSSDELDKFSPLPAEHKEQPLAEQPLQQPLQPGDLEQQVQSQNQQYQPQQQFPQQKQQKF